MVLPAPQGLQGQRVLRVQREPMGPTARTVLDGRAGPMTLEQASLRLPRTMALDLRRVTFVELKGHLVW